MKYANWSLVYANDLNNDSYDKHTQTIVDMTIDSTSDEDSLASIKKEPNLIFLTITHFWQHSSHSPFDRPRREHCHAR